MGPGSSLAIHVPPTPLPLSRGWLASGKASKTLDFTGNLTAT